MNADDLIRVTYRFGSAIQTKEGLYKELKDWIDSLEVQHNITVLKPAQIPDIESAPPGTYRLVKNGEQPVYKYKNPIDR